MSEVCFMYVLALCIHQIVNSREILWEPGTQGEFKVRFRNYLHKSKHWFGLT